MIAHIKRENERHMKHGFDAVKPIVDKEGFPIIDDVFMYRDRIDTKLVILQTKTKRIDCITTGSDENETPNISLIGCDESVYYDDKFEPDDFTQVSFPEFKDWNIFSVSTNKSSVEITFTRDIEG